MSHITKITPLRFHGNWSFSTLMDFEKCAHLVKLKKIDKLPQKPLEENNPMERGNRIHKNFEHFVQGTTQVLSTEPREIGKFKPLLEHLRDLYAAGMATTEEDWYFNDGWETTSKKYDCSKHGRDTDDNCAECLEKHWLHAKLDASIYDPSQSLAVAIDYKSGKSLYKAVEHIQQLQLYAALCAVRFPDADKIVAELWYVDEAHNNGPHIKRIELSREQALGFIGRFHKRADRLYNEQYFRANPTIETCRYCPYGPKNGTGACPVGV